MDNPLGEGEIISVDARVLNQQFARSGDLLKEKQQQANPSLMKTAKGSYILLYPSCLTSPRHVNKSRHIKFVFSFYSNKF